MRWAVLLAGGSGTRFWPLSTPRNPKQLLPLSGAASSAEESVERLNGLIPRERILVVTGHTIAKRLQESLHLPGENILVEPAPASTAPRSSGRRGRPSDGIPTPKSCRSMPTGPWPTLPASGALPISR